MSYKPKHEQSSIPVPGEFSSAWGRGGTQGLLLYNVKSTIIVLKRRAMGIGEMIRDVGTER